MLVQFFFQESLIAYTKFLLRYHNKLLFIIVEFSFLNKINQTCNNEFYLCLFFYSIPCHRLFILFSVTEVYSIRKFILFMSQKCLACNLNFRITLLASFILHVKLIS